MPEVGSASLAIIPSFDGFQSKIEGGSAKALTAAGASGGTKFGDAAGKSAAGKFKNHMRSAAKVAAVGFAATGAVAFKFASDSVAEARKAQKVGALTASTIKATGKAAKVSAKHVGDLAGKISAKTGIDDEAIQSGQNMLLTFKNIRNEAGAGNKIFDQTTRALVDMSSAMGTDAKSSAIQLGKALNDPLKGISALSRVGVTFDEQQKKQIAGFVKAGETMKAQKVILRELNGEFGGAAKAQATEADKLGVAWGNFKEEIGTQLLPVMDDLAVFLRKKGIPALEDAGKWVNKTGIPAMRDFADEIKPVVGHAKDLGKFLNDLPAPAKIAGLTALFGGIAALKLTGGKGGLLGSTGKVLGLAKPVPVFVVNNATKVTPGSVASNHKGLSLAGGIGALLAGAFSAGWAIDKFGPKNNAAAPKGGIQTQAPGVTGWAVGKLKDWFGPEEAKTLGTMNDGWAKVRETTDGASKATQFYTQTLKDVPTFWSTVFKADGLARNKALVEQYGSLLDGIPREVRTHFIQTTTRNNDTGEGGGGVVPGRSGGVTVNVGEVRAHDYRDFTRQMQRRARGAAGGGVNFP